MSSPSDSAPDAQWTQRGAFSVLRGERVISARLPFFSEAFRKAAHNLRGSWNPKLLAWQFPLAKEASLYRALDRLAESDPEALGDPVAANPDARPSLPSPASLLDPQDGGVLRARADEASGMILTQFDYHGALVRAARACPGARWVAARERWEIPLTHENARRVNAINERARSARALFERDNAPFVALELSSPISFSALPAPFELSLSFDPEAMAYRLSSWLDLSHPLGAWAVMEPLAALKLDRGRGEEELLISPKLGRSGGKSVLIEARAREPLMEALGVIQERLASLGEPRLVERPRLPAFIAALSQPGAPQDLAGGDVALMGQRAWLLCPSKRAHAPKRLNQDGSVAKRAPSFAWAFEISAGQTREWLHRWGGLAHARCAWASQIDLKALPGYLEALEISDSLGAAPSAKAPAAPRL